ncbi:hypothetical protein ACUZ8Y_17735 [Aeromonas veronii]|uniref:hypothetical protein n=1 Tax=Aeromonas veronii TaxID=654 RepID=UPI00406BC630
MSYKIYGPDGEYQGEVHESRDLSGLGLLYILGTATLIAFTVLSSLWDFLINWHVYSMPLNYVAAFYYYLIHGVKSIFTLPYNIGAYVFIYFEVWGGDFTEYRNINLIIVWCMKIAYISIALILVWNVLRVVYRLLLIRLIRIFLFIPAIFGAISFCVLWLFEK